MNRADGAEQLRESTGQNLTAIVEKEWQRESARGRSREGFERRVRERGLRGEFESEKRGRERKRRGRDRGLRDGGRERDE